MSQQYPIEQIPVNLNKIIQEVEQGETIEITREGEQIAVIISKAEYEQLVTQTKNEQLINQKTGFWESLQQFRQKIIEEGIDIDPDEIWKDVRDKSPGREVNL